MKRRKSLAHVNTHQGSRVCINIPPFGKADCAILVLVDIMEKVLELLVWYSRPGTGNCISEFLYP